MLVSKAVRWLFVSLIVIACVIFLFPELISSLFGANTPELTLYANHGLRIFVPMLPFILLALLLANIYQMLGHMVMTVAVVVMFPIILIPSLLIWPEIAGNDAIWYAFPTTGILVMLITGIITEVYKMKNGNVTRLTLVPLASKEEESTFNISVQANEENMSQSLNSIHEYLSNAGVEKKLAHDIALCIEELLLNIVHHAGRNMQSHYIDVHIHMRDGKMLASVKDDGRAFDPIHFDIEKRKAGLKLLNGLCPGLDYQYMYGQNMTFMNWDMHLDRNNN
jgi:anti-sigma regulatory factor (Ser/Thr protein kinase)